MQLEQNGAYGWFILDLYESMVYAPKLIWLLMTTQNKTTVWTDTGHIFIVLQLIDLILSIWFCCFGPQK